MDKLNILQVLVSSKVLIVALIFLCLVLGFKLLSSDRILIEYDKARVELSKSVQDAVFMNEMLNIQIERVKKLSYDIEILQNGLSTCNKVLDECLNRNQELEKRLKELIEPTDNIDTNNED